ncbi:MAG TPA: hypothetical protein VD766_11675 [Solirubrobacterales bacterium]|nr:hypothetical protein [Solirubrobacterales bacterium]
MILTAGLAASVAGGCGGDDESGSPIPSEGTIFEFSRAGGIAFSVYEVTIDADGTGVARFGSDVRNLEEKEFTLTDTELDELRTILEENPISSFPDPGDAVCADCFEYRYAYGGDEYLSSDVTEPVDGLGEIDAFLDTLPLPKDQPNGG